MKLEIGFFCLLIKCVTSDWVDPYDMNTNAKQKYISSSVQKSSIISYDVSTNNNEELYGSYLKRIMSLIINSAHIGNKDQEVYDGHIRFNIDREDWQFLTTFSRNEITLDKLRRLDTIFSETFKKSLINDYLDAYEWYQMKIYSAIVNIYNLWLIASLFILYFIYQLFKNNFSIGYITKYIIFAILVCDYGYRYREMLEEAEEHNLHIIYSAQCDTTKMSWREYTKFWFSARDCEKRTVTPLDVMLTQIKQLIIIPLSALGTGLGGFGKEMFTSLPWGVNLVMWPLMLVFVIIIIIFLMAFVSGTHIEFNMFHLIKLKFASSTSSRQENVLTGSTVERLMSGLMHRPMIQQVSTADVNAESETIRINAIQNNNSTKSTEASDNNKNNNSTKSTESSDNNTISNNKKDQLNTDEKKYDENNDELGKTHDEIVEKPAQKIEIIEEPLTKEIDDDKKQVTL